MCQYKGLVIKSALHRGRWAVTSDTENGFSRFDRTQSYIRSSSSSNNNNNDDEDDDDDDDDDDNNNNNDNGNNNNNNNGY